MKQVPVGLGTIVGYLLSGAGVACAIVSAIEHEFPATGKWCVIATAVIGAVTTFGRMLQATFGGPPPAEGE